MTFQPRDLCVLAYANGFTLWHYRSPDRPELVKGPDYFASAADMLRQGDVLLTRLGAGGPDEAAGLYAVTAERRCGGPRLVELGASV